MSENKDVQVPYKSIVDHDLNEDNIEVSENDNLEVHHDETIEEMSSNHKIQISGGSNNETKENFDAVKSTLLKETSKAPTVLLAFPETCFEPKNARLN